MWATCGILPKKKHYFNSFEFIWNEFTFSQRSDFFLETNVIVSTIYYYNDILHQLYAYKYKEMFFSTNHPLCIKARFPCSFYIASLPVWT